MSRRTLRFDKLCLRQSLNGKPVGGAPSRGESGDGSAARIYPSFFATITTVARGVPVLMVVKRRFVENPVVRTDTTLVAVNRT